ncbi:MAG: radical SAM protein [Candidatus Aminicenantes bacterium]|nr:radical SAM protein [Candidatus Aminicenantes bacterium]
MRILLIKPFSWYSAKGLGFPLSLGYLASSLLATGEEVWTLDLQIAAKEEYDQTLLRSLSEFVPEIVGITCNSHERYYSFDLARKVKAWKDVPVVMGGPHVTFTAEETLNSIKEIDFIVLHEGEDTLLELIKALKNGQSLKKVKGLAYRENGEISRTPLRGFIEDLDRLPFPARELFDVDKYDLYLPIYERPKAMHLITSRGCPYSCGFCSAKEMSGRTVRYASPERVIAEMELIKISYPQYNWLFFYDDHFTLKKPRVIKLCEEIIRNKLDFNWGCYGRVDSIDEEIVEAMKQAGCRMISFGVESGSDIVLSLMQKRITAKMIERALNIVKKKGLVARASFIFGYPGERLRDFLSTIKLCSKLGLDKDEIIWNFNPVIYPLTQLSEDLKKTGYFPDRFNWCEKLNIPNYKDVPLYVNRWSKLKELMGRAYKRFFVEYKHTPLYKSVPQYILERISKSV